MKKTTAAAILLLLATTLPINSAVQVKSLNRIMNDYFEERLRLFPLEATAVGDHRYDDQLANDISLEHLARQRALYTNYLSELSRLDRSRLKGEDALSYDVLKRDLETRLQGLRFDDHLMPVRQFWSLPLTFAQLGSGKSTHPFRTVKDYENFLSRMRGFEAWTETAITNMREGAARGITQPRILMERVLAQFQALLVDDVTKSIFYEPVRNMPAEFSREERERLDASYRKAITEEVLSSYRKLYDFIRTEYLPKCRTTAGLSGIPGGREVYAHLVRQYTTTSLTPDDFFKTGMSEVRRIRAEMERVKNEAGFRGDLKSFFDYLRTDKKFYPFRSDEEVLNAYRMIETRMQSALPQLFGITPHARFEVRATEKFRAASASEEYERPAPDGTRPGVFYVPIVDAKKYNSIRMESLFLHEAIPGHHYQISIQQEQKELPRFRQFAIYGAYTEGWALYTESLGRELGLYKDPYQYFGMLTQDMHRAIRLVVDTGMHWKGWTREEAIRFSLENEGLSEDRITAEVERYMAIPGQALSYKAGQLSILRLRSKAQRALGPRFQLRAFHDEILRDGALPLDVLESKINDWIRAQK
ncbi:MAG: DUF885 domain-containing protein [Pyrinomonadaceae bacterium]|nr:DUF885 domain-containing protein [Pyrinomonadaceae bacterium]